jgi:hypothetical protein
MIALVVSGSMIFFSRGSCNGASRPGLDWGVRVAKSVYYPGEPVLLTWAIKNNGSRQEEVDFGTDSIQGFSMEMRTGAGDVVGKGGSIARYGVSFRGALPVPPGEVAEKSIVLNQWCSTQLLPAGTYELLCHVQYRLRSEDQEQPGTIVRKAGPYHTLEFNLSIRIVNLDVAGFKEVLGKLRKQAFPAEIPDADQGRERDTAREMLIFTESPLAVPCQLEALAAANSSWLRRDAINSLAKAGTPEAAIGLVKFSERAGIDDIKFNLVDAVYRMRDSGKPEIMKATDEFAQKHERRVRAK